MTHSEFCASRQFCYARALYNPSKRAAVCMLCREVWDAVNAYRDAVEEGHVEAAVEAYKQVLEQERINAQQEEVERLDSAGTITPITEEGKV